MKMMFMPWWEYRRYMAVEFYQRTEQSAAGWAKLELEIELGRTQQNVRR